MTKQELCQKALAMRKMAYAPYSNFRVGAALECEDGTVFTGCNVENAGYSPTNCAERTAGFKAVSEGYLKFKRIAIAATSDQFTPPCGVCRQVLQEFAPDLQVILVNCKGETMELTLTELLPYGFDSGNLK